MKHRHKAAGAGTATTCGVHTWESAYRSSSSSVSMKTDTHTKSSLSPPSTPPFQDIILSLPLKLMEMLWEQSFQSSPDTAVPPFLCANLLSYDTFQPQELYIIECDYFMPHLSPGSLYDCSRHAVPYMWSLFNDFLHDWFTALGICGIEYILE